ncbi:hypothetical protein HYW73_01875 [Candidatus Nomurabacteria bacterium]|nr:hypothetical protein [Candidatus Nomurabacteria bacterium]
MRKARTFLILGVWIAILPFLGFPYSWKDILSALSGLAVMFLSYILYKEYKAKEGKRETFDNFKENDNFDLKDNTKDEIQDVHVEEESVINQSN